MNPEAPRQPPEATEQPKKRKETSALKRATAIALGLFGGGVAISSDSGIEQKNSDSDRGHLIHHNPNYDDPDKDSPKPLLKLPTPRRPVASGSPEPKPRSESFKPSASETPKAEGPETELLPEELQYQVDEIQNTCDEYLQGDPETILDPFRPHILQQLKEQYQLFIQNPERGKYNSTKYRLLDSFCGDGKTFRNRGLSLARTIESLPMTPFEKFLTLQNLVSWSSVYNSFSAMDVESIWDKLREAANSEPLYGEAPTEANAQNTADEKNFYREAFDKLSNSENLNPEEKKHLSRLLNLGKYIVDDSFSEEEQTQIRLFERDYLILPELIQNYKEFIHISESPPATAASENAYHSWRTKLYFSLKGIVEQMTNYGIDPEEIGSVYSWTELIDMLAELKVLYKESEAYFYPPVEDTPTESPSQNEPNDVEE